MKKPTPVLKDDTIYLGDNGMSLCGEHHGMNARFTGRDVSGQPVLEITPDIAAEAKRDMAHTIKCEQCGRTAA